MNTDITIFNNTKTFLLQELKNDILNFKKLNSYYSYQLLYDKTKDKDNIGNIKTKENENKDDIGPYYANSKFASNQVISKLKRDPSLLTNKQVQLISKNMKTTPLELLLGVKKISGKCYSYYEANTKFYFFFNKLLEDAFISDSNFFIILDLLKDYVPFSKIVSLKIKPYFKKNLTYNSINEETKYFLGPSIIENHVATFSNRNNYFLNDKNFRIELLNDSEFVEIFWDASTRLLKKINLNIGQKRNLTQNFETETVIFFQDENKLFHNLEEILNKFFKLCVNEYFKLNKSILSDTSYGSLLFDLLMNEVNNVNFEKSYMENYKIMQHRLIEQRKEFQHSVFVFSDALEKFQHEIDKNDEIELKKIRSYHYHLRNGEVEPSLTNFDETNYIELTQAFILKCKNCRFSITLEKIRVNWANSENYTFSVEKSLNCRHCNNEIKFKIKLTKNLDIYDIEIKKGICIQEPKFFQRYPIEFSY